MNFLENVTPTGRWAKSVEFHGHKNDLMTRIMTCHFVLWRGAANDTYCRHLSMNSMGGHNFLLFFGALDDTRVAVIVWKNARNRHKKTSNLSDWQLLFRPDDECGLTIWIRLGQLPLLECFFKRCQECADGIGRIRVQFSTEQSLKLGGISVAKCQQRSLGGSSWSGQCQEWNGWQMGSTDAGEGVTAGVWTLLWNFAAFSYSLGVCSGHKNQMNGRYVQEQRGSRDACCQRPGRLSRLLLSD